LSEAISAEEMAALEYNAEYLGVSMLQLMECAGKAVAEAIASLGRGKEVVIYAGTGRNGGDGMVAARHLASLGFKVTLVLVGDERSIVDPTAQANWRAVKSSIRSIEVRAARDSSDIPRVEAPIIVDALLGTGAKGRLRQPILEAVRVINGLKGFKVAIDLPTGIEATTGEILGEAVRADLTVTFHRVKAGLLKAGKYAGEIKVAGIGIPPEAETYVGPGDVRKIWKPRPPTAHKGDFGRILVIGGSEVYSGAPALAALAALRTGVDLAYIAAPGVAAQAAKAYSPNLIVFKLEGAHLAPKHVRMLKPLIERSTAVIIGPELETRDESAKALPKLLALVERLSRPVLLDADGLKIFSRLKLRVKAPCVLTPHRGEFKLLSGAELPEDLDEAGRLVRETAEKFGATILLKGPVDIVSDGVKVKFNRTGNPGMTAGGTGDILAGIVGGLMAMGAKPFEAAAAGAFVCGAAGDLAYKRRGFHLVATDLLEEIPALLDNPMLHREAFPF